MRQGDPILSLLLSVTLCFGASPLKSQVSERTLVIGTKQAPPFALLTEEGMWEGVSIELWRTIARELDLDYTFRELERRRDVQYRRDLPHPVILGHPGLREREAGPGVGVETGHLTFDLVRIP